MNRSSRLLGFLLAFGAPAFAEPIAPPPASEVRIGRSETGRRVIFNENATQRARRLSTVLLPVPDGRLAPLIEQHAAAQNLDPRLVKAVIQVESGYNQEALSNKGAIGLMQLMPGTARELAVDPYDPIENLRGGVTYLRNLLDRFSGQIEYALAAYNAGPGAVERHRGIPPYRETRDYVQRILSLYRGDATLREPNGFVLGGRRTYVVRRPGERTLITTAPRLRDGKN